MDTVELDAATDPELPQPLQGLLAQAGGPQALPVERQLQPSLLAQEQHLGREGVRAADLPTDPVPPASPSSPPRTQRLDPQGAQPWNGTGLGPGVSRCTWLFSALGLSFTICNEQLPLEESSPRRLYAGAIVGLCLGSPRLVVPGFPGMGCLALVWRVGPLAWTFSPASSASLPPGWESLALTHLEESLGVEEEGG